jgi:hypothetical protein
MTAFCDNAPWNNFEIELIMEAVRTSETSVYFNVCAIFQKTVIVILSTMRT